MSTDRNKKLVRRLFEEVFNKRKLNLVGDLLAPDYQLHDPFLADLEVGPEGYKKVQQMFFQAFPDADCGIEDQYADEDTVVTRWTMTGTQTGDLPDLPATGRFVKVSGITISWLSHGKIAEQWQIWDSLGFLRQLGITPLELVHAGS